MAWLSKVSKRNSLGALACLLFGTMTIQAADYVVVVSKATQSDPEWNQVVEHLVGKIGLDGWTVKPQDKPLVKLKTENLRRAASPRRRFRVIGATATGQRVN